VSQKAEHKHAGLFSDTEQGGALSKIAAIEVRVNDG
jgi:hypothetical protein